MTELVEDNIIAELKIIPCKSIIHDGWSRCRIHYLYYVTYYITKISSYITCSNGEQGI